MPTSKGGHRSVSICCGRAIATRTETEAKAGEARAAMAMTAANMSTKDSEDTTKMNVLVKRVAGSLKATRRVQEA